MRHQIDVEFSTHDHLKMGITEIGLHRVVIHTNGNTISDEIHAMETAYLMVCSRGLYPTRLTYCM